MGRHTRARFPRLAARLYAHKKRLRSERIEFVRKKGYATRLCFFFRAARFGRIIFSPTSLRAFRFLWSALVFSLGEETKRRGTKTFEVTKPEDVLAFPIRSLRKRKRKHTTTRRREGNQRASPPTS